MHVMLKINLIHTMSCTIIDVYAIQQNNLASIHIIYIQISKCCIGPQTRHPHCLSDYYNYPLLLWFCSYNSEREQQVLVIGGQLKSARVLSGVPQGSVLGPLLFLIYIDMLLKIINLIHTIIIIIRIYNKNKIQQNTI